MGYDEDLTSFEDGLRRLKVEYHIFFAGNRKKPPDELKLRVEKLAKKLSECTDMSLSQRFRFSTLITRFYVYRDLWRRTLFDKETGTGITAASQAGAPAKAAGSTAKPVRISISDPENEEKKVQLLYRALLETKKANSREAPISYRQFAKYIATQTHVLREKYGCSAVAFTVAFEEDAVRFTASAENA
jgi:hypothetical protein